MYRIISYSKDIPVSNNSADSASEYLEDAARIADILQNGVYSTLYINRSGIPVLLIQDRADNIGSPFLPVFWELDEMCSEQSFKASGQASLVTDILVRAGFCTYKNGKSFRSKIAQNLKDRTFILLVKS